MKLYSCQQGSSEWLNLRAGIPTASAFDNILTPGGEPSKSAERYLYTLLAERLMGHPITKHVSMWMRRGSEAETDAVQFYEFQRDVETVPVGFMSNDGGTIGASPDRLVGDDGLLEIKCPSEYIHVGYLMQEGSHYDAYRVQCQGQLWVSERQWVDVVSYHPEMPMALVRIERDEQFIDSLAAAVTAFSHALEEQFAILVERGWVKEQKPAPAPRLSRIMADALIEVQKGSQ